MIHTSFGLKFLVYVSDQQKTYLCTTKSKKNDYACGDMVSIQIENSDQAVILKYLPRSTLLYRQDDKRSKLIAANVDQILLVFAPRPKPNWNLLDCGLIAAFAANIAPIILLNKSDLSDFADCWQDFAYYRNMGIKTIALSAKQDIQTKTILDICLQHHSVLVGSSGVGKTTIIKQLFPDIIVRTNGLSAINQGKHTTTNARRYELDTESSIMDVPGLQHFGLSHLKSEQLLAGFPDLALYSTACKFNDCKHDQEPECAVRVAVQKQDILPRRLNLWKTLQLELNQPRY